MAPPGDEGAGPPPPPPGVMTFDRPGTPAGGAPCRPRRTASILARISDERLSPPPLLEMVGAFGGRGFRAAFMLPSGVDEGVIFVVAPLVDMERTEGRCGSIADAGDRLGRGGSEGVGEEGVGEEGEGEPKGLSESNSSPGVEVVEAMAGGMRVVKMGRCYRERDVPPQARVWRPRQDVVVVVVVEVRAAGWWGARRDWQVARNDAMGSWSEQASFWNARGRCTLRVVAFWRLQ
jgi:hypothetical protein